MDKTKLPSASVPFGATGTTEASGPAGIDAVGGSGLASRSDTEGSTDGGLASGLSERSGLPSRLIDIEKGDRGGVFHQLVLDDGDIAGLVAYSIYKQNKLNWLNAFDSAKHRAPTEDELAAYVIGEGTPRRLATYRHLADATLAGNGPSVGTASGASNQMRMAARSSAGLAGRNLAVSVVATYALAAVLLLVVFLLLAHYTMSPR